MPDGKTILVTGSPGFIGANLVMRLLKEMTAGTVISLDNLNDYYDPALKLYRLKKIEELRSPVKHIFLKGDISDKAFVDEVFRIYQPSVVVNLAAQAGVRYSIEHPEAYIRSNIVGFFNILEACRNTPGIEHLVYASSSSVYGGNTKVPFSTDDMTDSPVSLYAATKKSDELLAHSYAKLYGIPATGLRFFTVYGPAGRPDMFYFSAAEKFIKGDSVKLFNYGDCERDFTYIDDIVEGILRVMKRPPEKKKGEDGLLIPPHKVYNIGGGKPENLGFFISTLKDALADNGLLPKDFDLEAHIDRVAMQPGDVQKTFADTKALEEDFGFIPSIGLKEGLYRFAEWYREYRGGAF